MWFVRLFKFVSNKNLLFVPAAVMNKVFDLFILDVYLNTLRKERKLMVESLDGKREGGPTEQRERTPTFAS